MKRLALVLLLAVFAVSCTKTEHQLRIKNDNPLEMNVLVGDLDFGSVLSGVTSSYQPITIGTHELGGDLVGDIAIEGEGKHKWTMTIDQDGKVAVAED